MKDKQTPLPERQRKIPPNFSWLDHRLVRDGYLTGARGSAGGQAYNRS